MIRRRRRRADEELLRCVRALVARGLVTGTVGNVSVRRGDRVRITPTRVPYAAMRRRDLVTVDLRGAVVRGSRHPSRELPLHLAVYRARPDVGAIVHTHSVHATAWSFLDRALPPATEEAGYYGIGPIATSRRAAAGTDELAEAAVAALGTSRAVLLGGHGVLAAAASLELAHAIAEAVEHQAAVAWLLGGGHTHATTLARSRLSTGDTKATMPRSPEGEGCSTPVPA